MQINPNPVPDLLAALAQNQQQINIDLAEISSGQSVSQPSDNPAAAASLVQNANDTAADDQYLRSIGSVQGEMESADSALNSVTTALQQAISLGTEGANGGLNGSDRAAIAVQVQGVQSQLLNLANLTYQGNYVFAGTATQTAPFMQNESGISYVGNTNINHITLGDNFSVQTNLPGSQLFGNVFQGIQDLITGLETNDTSAVETAVNEVSTASASLDGQRVFYGNAISQLSSQQTYLNTETTQLAQQQNTIEAADLPTVISNLESEQVSRQATLEAMAQIQQNNLFSYLK